jgi:hypothetical protein
MLIERNALKVAKAASDDPERYAITGVLVQEDGSTIATNGTIVLHYIPAAPDPEFQYPLLEYLNPEEAEPLKPFIMPAKDALELAKAPQVEEGYELLKKYVSLDAALTNRRDTVVIGDTDMLTEHVRKIRKIDAKFPDVRALLQPTGVPVFEVVLSVHLLKKLLDSLHALGFGDARFSFYGPLKPVQVEGHDPRTGADFAAAIAPMKDAKAEKIKADVRRAVRDMAPKRGSGIDSVTISSGGESVTLTPEDREGDGRKAGEVAAVLAGAVAP